MSEKMTVTSSRTASLREPFTPLSLRHNQQARAIKPLSQTQPTGNEMADNVLSSASRPQPAASLRLRWDVFLSFHGEDTRHTVVKLLYDKLEQHGVRVFLADDGLARSDETAPSPLEAIEDSAASIVILSPRYATSHRRLEELAKIVECRRLILPYFFTVDPSHVRRQSEAFGEPFRSHEERFGAPNVGTWRRALEKVGSIAGWLSNESDEKVEEKVCSVVKRVLAELSNTPLRLASCMVGLDSRVEEVENLLDVKSNGVRLLVLHGLGGVGKTTLAKALYNRLVGHFEHRSFISNVRENFKRHNGLVSLQNQLISDLSQVGVGPVGQADAGTSAIKRIVHGKRVLIVLDDVDDVNQLDALAVTGENEWFHEGSRILITTRDRELVSEHQVSNFYEVKELHLSDALKLFSHHAVRKEQPTDKFMNLSKQIVSLTGGLPLALEVFGSFLFDKRRIEEWEDALEKLKVIRPRNLQDVLRISFDGRNEEEKCIFLDLACFFVEIEMKREDAIDILKGCGFKAEIALTVLTAKSLIKITEDQALWMHDQLRDMGRQIVQEGKLNDPGMHSRLWDQNEIMTVLKNDKGTKCIQGITLDFKSKILAKHPSPEAISLHNLQTQPSFVSAASYIKEVYKKYVEGEVEEEKEVILFTKPFEKMVNLRLLKINHVKLEGKFKYLPGELKWLQWKGCPLKSLPSDFCPKKLAVLDLSESKIEQLWGWTGWYGYKVAENLRVMNLYGCYNLTTLPDLSGNCTLEKIVLEHCSGLTKIHKSIGKLQTLLHLNLRNCKNLIEFPSDVSGLNNLESFILSGCKKLEALPETIGCMTSLKELLVDETSLAKLPESISHLTKLETLSLNRCQYLKLLPNCMGKLSSLKLLSLNGSAIEQIPYTLGSLGSLEKLSLAWCSKLTTIPDSAGKLTSLIELTITGSAITELPVPVGSLSYLKYLSVANCNLLTNFPDSVEGLASIREIHLEETSITSLPEQIGTLKTLVHLQMMNCKHLSSLPPSIGGLLALTSLNLHGSNIVELPESIGMLENLNLLNLNKCRQLLMLPASIGELKDLRQLLMEETAVTELPDRFGMLSRLRVLHMAKRPHLQLPQNRRSTGHVSQITEENQKVVVLPNSFSRLSFLEELDARSWNISAIPDDFEKLSSMESLHLDDNRFCSFPSSLRGLTMLRKLYLRRCDKLKSLPLLPSSLVELNAAGCTALESIADISNLASLEELNVTNCEKLVDLPGLECLKSLRRLYMSGCNMCASVVKKRLTKVSLKNLRNLSMPGREIPDWFCQESVSIPDSKIIEIKAVVIGVVVSVNQQVPDELRDELPGIVDILVRILKLDMPIFSTTLHLMGVPKTDEDHVHLCRFASFHPLVSMLRKDYMIQVTKQNPPFVKGIELKKWGIHLVFENDDDFDGDEELLDEDRQSVSEKLAKFFSSS